jgi:hypothetical protein
MATFSQQGSELEFNADVQPPPTVASISPASGPTTGGTAVTIAGQDFNDVTDVRFGSNSAQSFTVRSENSIAAVSPPGPPGKVDVLVTTVAGTNSATPAGEFTYAAPTHCVVPKLRGKRLKAAKRRLRKSHCKLGKVSGPKGRLARVRSQRPRPGTVLPVGGRVRVKTRPAG